ncbi:hypothetical protein ACXAUS_002520 [Clostridium sporogenes]
MSSKNFTQVDNRVLDDENISFEAKGVYTILVRQYSKPEFKLYKSHIQKLTGLGETRFNRAWKELKEKGILTQVKKRVKGKFVYEYILQTAENKEEVKEEPQKPVESEGNAPIEGQVYIDDVIEEFENDSVEEVAKETEFNKLQSSELLKLAKNDINKIIQCHKYALRQNNVRNIFYYTKWCIKNNKTLNRISASNIKVDKFNDYPQRDYNFTALESALLGKEYTSLYN